MPNTFTYAGHELAYSARFTPRKTLSISVLPDGAVEVIAPIGTEKGDIETRLRKRGRWILAQQRYFEQFKPRTPPRLYVGGETHLYLGRQYRLKIAQGMPESVKLKGGYFCVDAPDAQDTEHIASLLQKWYRERAEAKLRERYERMLSKFEHLLDDVPALSLRAMKQRWGSFSPSGRIILNVGLIRAPSECIDYVAAHELAHVVQPNHGRAFYQLLETVMPDWRTRKQRLERLLA